MIKKVILLVFISLLFACNKQNKKDKNKVFSKLFRQTIYYGGDIVTMEGSEGSMEEAVVSQKDKIVFVGSLKDAENKYPNAEKHNLNGKTLFPGFIEQHLHPFLGALTLTMEIIAPEPWELPDKTWEGVYTPEDYLVKLSEAEKNLTNPNEILLSWGYHNNFHGTMSRRVLDKISDTRPILIWHRSCHEFYLNSTLMDYLGLNKVWLEQFNKEIKDQIDLSKGHFYEAGAMLALLPKIFPIIGTNDRIEKGLEQMVQILRNNGVTAFSEPGAFILPDHIPIYKKILGDESTPLYSFFTPETKTPYFENRLEGRKAIVKAVKKSTKIFPKNGKIRFFKKQIKILNDGAIISQLMMMEDGYLDGHHGEWIQPPQEVSDLFDIFWPLGYQILIHVNGDKGLEEVLAIIERKMKEEPREDHRTTIIHFANSNEDQVKKLAKLGCIVSANPYYVTAFSDKYAEVGLGPKRANSMVRLSSVEELGVPISLHSDLPMAPANPLYLAWCATTRETLNGNHPRVDLVLSLHGALKGITINAAQSWRMEDQLGSLKVGKIANFTIMDLNPYKVGATKLKDIQIWGTVFEGKVFPLGE